MLRKGTLTDAAQIERIVKRAVPLMQAMGNIQWDDEYPTKADFAKDAEDGTLYVWEEEGQVLGACCINFEQPEDYANVLWTVDRKPTAIHRMVVDPSCRGTGIGKAMFALAEKLARENGTHYLRTDTYGKNLPMNGLMQAMGFQFVGYCHFPGKEGDYHCYEKVLKG